MAPSRVLGVVNQKGGVGKSNVVGNLAAELAALARSDDRSVIVIDLDPQATLTHWMLGFADDHIGMAEVLLGEATLSDILVDVPQFGVRLAASRPKQMRRTEKIITGEPGSERILSTALRAITADFVLIDCPPALGTLTSNALLASTGIIIPVAASEEALDGFNQVLETLERLREGLEIPVQIEMVVPTFYDERERISRELVPAIKKMCNARVVNPIRHSMPLRRCFAQRIPVRSYEPKSPGALDYACLAAEVYRNGQA